MMIRSETSQDVKAIRHINIEAFRNHPHSEHTEHLIVEALRVAGALEISLVAEVDGAGGAVVGHIAFSRAAIGEIESGWYLLGPMAVLPEFQGRGIGRALVEAGLAELRARHADGCALVGDPKFYGRFGFVHVPGVFCQGVPDEYVLCLRMEGPMPQGEVVHHPAFGVTADSCENT